MQQQGWTPRRFSMGSRVLSRRLGLWLCVLLSGALWLGGCGDDAEDAEPIIGSRNVVEMTTDAMFVESVRIALPFRATVYNGAERRVLLEGEDNLLEQISVTEVNVGEWNIEAPLDLMFEQNEDIRVEIPFIEMVTLRIVGDDILLEDDPFEVWEDGEDPSPEG